MIIVTGGTGFLGSHLICKLLLRGSQVTALKRETSGLKHFQTVCDLYFHDQSFPGDRLHWMDADVTSLPDLTQVISAGDKVYHCAAEVDFHPADLKRQYRVNVNGTANIVDACLERKAQKLVHVSSIGALGDPFKGQGVDEETPRKHSVSQTPYSKTKYLGELEVFRGMAEGLSAVVVNPAVITGPGDTHSGMRTLISMISEGLEYYPAGTSAWVDVRDVADAMILLMESEFEGERYILSSGNYSYQEVMNLMAENLGAPKPGKRASKGMMRLVSVLLWIREKFSGRKNPLTTDLIRIASSVTLYDREKFIRATGFQFMDLNRSVKDSCDFFRKS